MEQSIVASTILNACTAFMEFVISSMITYKLYYHLYLQSTNYNWIIEPSPSNKFLSVLCPLCFSLNSLGYSVVFIGSVTWINTIDMYETYCIGPRCLAYIGIACYFYYLISTIECEMRSNELFHSAIPSKTIFLSKCAVIVYLVRAFLLEYIGSVPMADYEDEYKGIPYILISEIVALTIRSLLELSLLYLYFLGLNSVNNYWYSLDWQAYQRHGSTQKIHEKLIVITRCTVIICISCALSFLTVICHVLYHYVLKEDAPETVIPWTDAMLTVLQSVDEISYLASIYFVYEFGYGTYKRYCVCCHDRMYSYCQKKHQRRMQYESLEMQ